MSGSASLDKTVGAGVDRASKEGEGSDEAIYLLCVCSMGSTLALHKMQAFVSKKS